MTKNQDEFFKSRPQRLCHMCGGCCRVVTTAITHEKLQTMTNQGDKAAIDFLEIFEPYESIEAARLVNQGIVDNVISVIKKNNSSFDENTLTFYKCRYLLENNLCGIYQNKKELCDRFPSSPWGVVPPGCGFEGWLFQKREELKQKIRKQKENLLIAQALLNEATTTEQKERINNTIENIKRTINLYAEYGSNDW